MKIKMYDLLTVFPVLNKLFSQEVEFKMAYRLKRLLTKISSQTKNFNKKREELISKYGSFDDKGKLSIKEDKMEDFQKELSPLLGEEIDLDIDPIPFDLLEKSGVKLSANDLVVLDSFIKSKEEKSKNEKNKV